MTPTELKRTQQLVHVLCVGAGLTQQLVHVLCVGTGLTQQHVLCVGAGLTVSPGSLTEPEECVLPPQAY